MTNILLQMENLPWWAYVLFCVGAFCVLLLLNFAVKKFNEYRLEKKRRRLRSFKRPSIDFSVYAVSELENPPEPMGNQNKPLTPDRNPQTPGISFVFSKEENGEPNIKDVKISENEENEETEIVKLPSSTNLEKKTNTEVSGSIKNIKESDCATSLFKIEDCKNETKLEIENNLQNENIGIKPSPLYIQPSERDSKSERKFSKKSNIDSESKENGTNKPTQYPAYENNINRDVIHGEIFEVKEMDHSFESKKEEQMKTEIHKAIKSSPRSRDMNEKIIAGNNSTFYTKHNKMDDGKEKEIQQHSDTHVIYSSHIFKSEFSIMETSNKKTINNQLEDNSKSVVEQKTEKNPQQKQLPVSIKSSEINKNEIDYKTKENGVSNFSTTTFVKYETNNNINVEVSMPQADNLYHDLNNKIGDQMEANINTENEFKKVKHNVSTAFSTQNSNCIITNDVTECEQTIETTSLRKDDILLQSKVSASAELFAVSKTEDQRLKEAVNFVKPTLNQTKKEDLENRKDRIAHDNIKVHEPLGLSLENKKIQKKQGNSKVEAPSKMINKSKDTELFALTKNGDQGLKEAINLIKPTINQTKKEDLENRKDRIAHDNIKVHEPLGPSIENENIQEKQGNSKVDAPSKMINKSKDTELFAFSKTEDQGLKEATNVIKPTLNQTKKEDLENRKDRIAHDNIKVQEPLGLSSENKKIQEKQGNSKVDAPSKMINKSKDTELFAFSKTEDQGLKEATNVIKPTLNQTKKEDLENRKDRIAHDNIKVHEPLGPSIENKNIQEKQGNSKVDAPSKMINKSKDTELFAFSKTEDQGLKEATNVIKPTLNQTKKEDLENRKDRIAHDNIKVQEPLGLSSENKKIQEKQGNSKVDAPSKMINKSKDTQLFAFSKTEDQGLKEATNVIKPTLNQTKKEDLENRKDRIAHDNIKVHEPLGPSIENKNIQEKQGNSKVDAPSKMINKSKDTELFAFSKTEDQGLKEATNVIKPTLNQTKKEDLENRKDRIAHDNIKVQEPLGPSIENKNIQEKQGNSKVDAPSKMINKSKDTELFAFSKTEDQGLKEAINLIKPTINQTKKEDLENREDRIAHDNIKVHEPLGPSIENKNIQEKQGNSKVDAPSKMINKSKDTELFAFSKTEDQGLKEAINLIKPTINQTKKEDLENRKDRIAHDNIKVQEPLGPSIENENIQEKQGNSKVDAPSKMINKSKDTELFAFSKTEDQGLKEATNVIKPTLNQTKKEDLENRKDRIAHDNIKVQEPLGPSIENKNIQEKQGNSKVDALSKMINKSKDTELFAFSKTEDPGLKEATKLIKPTLNQTKKEDLENRKDRIAHDNIKVHEPLGPSIENKNIQEKQGNSKVDAPSKMINKSKDTELFAFSKTEDPGLKEATKLIKPTLNQTKKEDLENRQDRIAHDNIKVHEPLGPSIENKNIPEKQGNSKVEAPSKMINKSKDTELFALTKNGDQGLKEAINLIKPTINQTKKEDLENRKDRIAHDNIKVHEPLGPSIENKNIQEKQGNSKVDAPSKMINKSKDTELVAISKTEDPGLKEATKSIKPTLNQTKKEDLENRKDRIAHDNIKVQEPLGLNLENKKIQEKQGNSKVDAPSKMINKSKDAELFAFSKTEDPGLKEAINLIKPTINQTKKEDLENRKDRIAHDNIKVHEPLGLSLENKKSQEKQGNSKVDAPSKIINISKDTKQEDAKSNTSDKTRDASTSITGLKNHKIG